MSATAHKDCAGRIISVGDSVATNDSGYTSNLVVGVVIGETPKKVKIRIRDRHSPKGGTYETHPLRYSEITKFPEQVCIVR